MDIRKVKKLIELLESSDITEIEIKEGDEGVRISRASNLAHYKVTQKLTSLIKYMRLVSTEHPL